MTCELCNKEPGILGVTASNYQVGEACYASLIERRIAWGPDSSLESFKIANEPLIGPIARG